MNDCRTWFGARLLKRWVAAPLIWIESIEERIDSVEDLSNNINMMRSLQEDFSKLSDLEKKLSWLYKYSINRNQKAIYFENVSLKQLNDLKSTLDEMENVQKMI